MLLKYGKHFKYLPPYRPLEPSYELISDMTNWLNANNIAYELKHECWNPNIPFYFEPGIKFENKFDEMFFKLVWM
jgi:hypothetical protein